MTTPRSAFQTPHSTPSHRRVVSLVVLIGAFLLNTVPAYAHGATTVQVDGDFGPYHVVALTGHAPSSAPNSLLLTVVLTEKPGNPSDLYPRPVNGATLNASIETSAPSPPFVVLIPAERKRASDGYYETILDIPSDGDIRVTLQITGPRGLASTSFIVTRSPWTGWLTFAAELIFAGALFIYLFTFAARRRRSRAKAQSSPDLPAS